MADSGEARPIRWVGSSMEDLRSFPVAVRAEIGHALFAAQRGFTDPSAKPLKGFGGAGVLEIVAPHRGDTWRAVYAVYFESAVYVLHAFQKKSKSGIAMPRREMELIRRRLTDAERDSRKKRLN